ncbi:hypothetical protein ACOMICROBIO_NCLOACGD_02106 [Vibrio sp. B1ASS3]|nr:hypothetical protein ACOMICROBIO_NCLOACGD_02106 [Vibrio sp. B1ASS3]CAE6910458.1 hypothetical protein ACOMICROBIO_NCLOACGD_02106 [Vibrio sp. B1ASS3]
MKDRNLYNVKATCTALSLGDKNHYQENANYYIDKNSQPSVQKGWFVSFSNHSTPISSLSIDSE